MMVAALTLPIDIAFAQNQIQSQTKWTSLGKIAERIFQVMLVFLPAIATIYLAISGYRYMIAQGNPDLVEKAKKSLTYAVVGVVLAYASVLIIRLIAGTLRFGY